MPDYQPQTINSFVLGGVMFCQAMIVALAYYWVALEDKSRKVNFYIIEAPAKFLPFIMLFVTLVQAGLGPTLVEATGIVAAHLYLFLTNIWPRVAGGPYLIFTPQWVHGLFNEPAAPATTGARAPGITTSAGATVTRSKLVPANSQWTHRGQGHRLGS
jgi:Derlin-2/3